MNEISINKKKLFSLTETRDLLPIVKKITRDAVQKSQSFAVQMRLFPQEAPQRIAVEKKLNRLLNTWASKMLKLGAEVKGLWLIDFDNGEGYYCWHYPEPDIEYYHSYLEGFTNRQKIN